MKKEQLSGINFLSLPSSDYELPSSDRLQYPSLIRIHDTHMAPEQIQACLEACKLCAEAGDVYLRALEHRGESEERTLSASDAYSVLADAIGMCRVTASSLARPGKGSRICCETCAQLCALGASVCDVMKGEMAAQCARTFAHCADECRRLAAGLPQAVYLA